MKRSMKGWELRKGIEDATHKICSALHLRPVLIQWDGGMQTACINKKGTMILADVKDDAIVTYDLFLRYLGFVIHELLHRKYTTFGLSYSNTFVSMLANALEDARIEHNAIATKLTGNVEMVLTKLIDGMVTKALAEVTDWNDTRQLPFVLAVYARKHATVKVPVHATVKPIFDEACICLNTCKNSEDVRDLAEWVYEQLKAATDEQDEDGKDDGDKGKDKGEKSDGESSGNGDGAEAEDGESGDTKQGDTQDGEGKPLQPINPYDAVDPEPTLDIEKGIGGTVSWNPTAYLARPQEHVGRKVQWNTNVVGGARLRYEVRRLFEMSGLDEYQLNRRTGILNVNALHTVRSGNDRVFKRHIEEGGIDSAVVFVLDCSGSMFDVRMTSAIRVLSSMLDTLDRAGVATSIVTFGTQVSLLKPWEMNKKTAVELLSRIESGADNSDSQALRYAHQLLLNRPEQRKVAFVLADGGVYRHEQKRCLSQAKSGERLGISTIGIGIQADLSKMYQNNIIVESLDDLANTSFKQIKLAA